MYSENGFCNITRRILKYKGYTYRRDKRGKKTYWRCVEKACEGRAITENEFIRVTKAHDDEVEVN